jgi:DNA polymerase-3 subunit gamma/tau
MDVMEIDAASNRGIDEIRELKEKVRYTPARDPKKIFIIDEVHMLTTEAFNALLKTLEEPPPHVVFIMATTEYHKIPATILSRCQQFNFKLIPYPLILKRLGEISRAEDIKISDPALEQIVFASGGSMRDAMSSLDQVIAFSGQSVRDEDVALLLGLVAPEVLGGTVRAIAENDADRILRIIAELVESGQDLQTYCRSLLGQIRNLMVLKSGVSDTSVLGIPDSTLEDLQQQASLFSKEDLLRLFDALMGVDEDMRRATQVRFQLEMGLVELAQIKKLRSLEELIEEIRQLTGPSPSGGTIGGSGQPGRSKPKPGSRAGDGNPRANPSRQPPARGTASKTEEAGGDPRSFLLQIAAAISKESLEPILQCLTGATCREDQVVLDLGGANEFVRRQLKDHRDVIAEAASAVVGREVRIRLGDDPLPAPRQAAASEAAASVPPPDLLEDVKREPIIRSFLDTFPGPVKTEKIDP